MNNIEWTIVIEPGPTRDAMVVDLRERVCAAFHLCESVGCGCVTGDGPVVCTETDTGGSFPMAVSDGPNWSVTVRSLPQSLILTMFFELQVLGSEVRAFHKYLVSLGHPVLYSTGGVR